MADRKQAIFDLERCTCHVPDACRDCSKYDMQVFSMSCMENLMTDALELLKEPEIVRCRNCIYFNSEPDSHGDYCNKIHWSRGLDWFCADGERREAE